MPYGILKVDTITFTDAGVDKSVAISGLVQNPTFTGNVTATGTISGLIVQAPTVTGTTANFASGVYTTQISGAIVKVPAGTASAPSIQVGVGASVAPGLYGAGTDLLGISTGGAGRIFIDSTGRLGVGTSSPQHPLQINAAIAQIRLEESSASAKRLELWIDSSSVANIAANQSAQSIAFQTTGAERLRIDSSGRLLVGTSAARGNFFNGTNTAGLQVEGLTSNTATISIVSNANTLGQVPCLVLGKTRGTAVGSNTIVQNNDLIGFVCFQGADGTNLVQAALIEAQVDGTPGVGDMPGRLVFSTTADGASTPTERLRIDSSGNVGIGTTSLAAKLTVYGDGTSSDTIDVVNPSATNGATIRFADVNSSSAIKTIPAAGTHSLGFFVANSTVERMRIDSSGRLLVGTSTAFGSGVNDSNYSLIQIRGNTAGGGSEGRLTLGNTTASASIVAGNDLGSIWFTDGSGGDYARILAEADGAGGSSDYPGRLVFSTTSDGASSPTERLRIDSSGRVGIGTTSPWAPGVLDCFGNAKFGASSTNGLYVGITSGIPYIQGYDSTTPFSSVLSFYAGASEAMRIDGSGRLLVGTSVARTIATQSLAIQNEGTSFGTTGFSTCRNSNDIYGPYIHFGKTRGASVGSNTIVASGDDLGGLIFAGADGTDVDSQAAYILCQVDGTPGANDMPGRLVFYTTADGTISPTERMRISQNGNSLFRTNANNNNATLTTYSDSTSGFTDSIVDVVFAVSSPNNTTARFAAFRDTTIVRAEIRSNGGIANFSANNVNLSDINAKKDIAPAANTWDCLKEWEIVNFRYKDQPGDADLNMGVIAQQVAESCPEVITVFQEAKEATEDQPAQEERLGVKEQQMYWMAIKALQEAQLRIETLEAKVAALEGS